MAQIDPIKFGDVAVLLGDGATPTEAFAAECGVTSIQWTTSTDTQDEDLPDCADPDAPSYKSPNVVSTGDQVQLQGFVDASGHIEWMTWIRGGATRNVRISYNKGTNAGGGRKGYYEGPAICTNREEGFERRQSGKISVTITFKAAPAWTPLV